MAPIIPSTTATITVGNVGTTLGNATQKIIHLLLCTRLLRPSTPARQIAKQVQVT